MGKQLVLLVPVPVEAKPEFYSSWVEVQPIISMSATEN